MKGDINIYIEKYGFSENMRRKKYILNDQFSLFNYFNANCLASLNKFVFIKKKKYIRICQIVENCI